MDATAQPVGRPDRGLGHYLRDIVYGASDGVVTTLAVIAGVAGAQLSPWVGFVLGIANLLADGVSMAVSNYLGLKSELEQNGRSVTHEQPWRHGAATLGAFITVGAVPLLAFVADGRARLPLAFVLGVIALAIVGALRGRFVARRASRCAVEMVVLAGSASVLAYLVGSMLRPLVA